MSPATQRAQAFLASSLETRTVRSGRVGVDLVHVRLAEVPARCLARLHRVLAMLGRYA